MQHNTDTLGTPSVLSLATTEWEYQPEEEKVPELKHENANLHLLARAIHNPGHHLQIPSMSDARGRDHNRKSSGYDSLGGESSSLDSNQSSSDKPVIKEVPSYSSPNDVYATMHTYDQAKDMQIVQYDELDIMRMEHRVNKMYS